MTDPIEDRVARALDRLADGVAIGTVREDDAELAALLATAGFLRESMVRVPAPAAWREDLGQWLRQPRPRRWWERLPGPAGRAVPAAARRPGLAAAVGVGALAVVVGAGVVALRRRAPAPAA